MGLKRFTETVSIEKDMDQNISVCPVVGDDVLTKPGGGFATAFGTENEKILQGCICQLSVSGKLRPIWIVAHLVKDITITVY